MTRRVAHRSRPVTESRPHARPARSSRARDVPRPPLRDAHTHRDAHDGTQRRLGLSPGQLRQGISPMVRARDAMKRRDDGTRWDRAPPRDGGREPIARAPQRARSSRGTVDAMKRTREIGRVGGERAGGWRTPCEGRGWMRARWVMGRPRALTRRRRETDLEGFFVVSTAACVKTSGRSSASTT